MADCVARLVTQPVPASWLALAALTWICGSFALKVPQVPASISVSETFVFMILLLFGGPPATLTVVVDGLLTSTLRQDRQLRRLLFNAAEPAISMWIAWHAFTWASGSPPLITAPNTLGALLLPMLLMTSVYFLSNSWLTALAVATDTGLTPVEIWRTHFVGVWLNYFAGASVALLVALHTREVSWGSFGAALPLVLLLYATFNGRIRRSEDSNRHLAELNRLYLSTVEGLALAIDAKDQVTHGHIRRVQAHAVELGRRLGICGERELKALETAALLHDMGKLAVPDYILNKPGKLTASEYERVKHHAVVGAEILSTIEFPYPVVPIVRHHHENWDGSGYPDGLRGDTIPLGARILAVVDCYDALTSDRPYRRALDPDEAIQIITDRRDRMYDPTVVDAFLELQPGLREVDADREAEPTSALARIARSSDPAAGADAGLPATPPGIDVAEPLLEAWSTVRAQAGQLASDDLVEIVARRIRRLTPASLVVVFRADAGTQELIVAHASGAGENRLSDLRLPFGRGTAGWVAANQMSVINSDPALDTGTRLHGIAPALESSLALPLFNGTTLVGVLTCYAPAREAFTNQHRTVAEALATAIAPELERSWCVNADRVSAGTLEDGRLASRHGLQSVGVLVARAEREATAASGPEPAAWGNLSTWVEYAAYRAVRASDVVVRSSDGETVVLLARVDVDSVREIAERLRTELDECAAGASLRIGLATAPQDGSSLDTLLTAARARMQSSAPSAPATDPCSESREPGAGFAATGRPIAKSLEGRVSA
jgi:putative nucleotidyltransferase with HDIG domain